MIKRQPKETSLVCLINVKPYDAGNSRQMEQDYYSVFFGVREAVKKSFQKHGIHRPITALDVEPRRKKEV